METSFALAFLAGALSILSPCVLPLTPIVLGAAASEHRLGPLALAGGVSLSFVAAGLFLATIGFSLGADGALLRQGAAALLVALGVVLAVPALQNRAAAAGGPVSDFFQQRFGAVSAKGVSGQFAVGLLLGLVWSPCVGPTLGAASVLAAQGRSLGAVAATMALFGLGAGIPLALLGALSRSTLMRWRDRLIVGGKGLKTALGAFLILAGGLTLTGLDKRLETALVNASPAWLTQITTRF
ncbi:MAG: cytochrome c biogenesis protein CcdA [Hyphomicrobiales bacterium]|nr:cytochrome c biogenesis protein CcdA [Hyphomicrobiales bacterium]